MLYTFRVCQRHLASRFKLSQAAFSKAITSLQGKGLILPLSTPDYKEKGQLYTMTCNKLWSRAFVPAPQAKVGSDWAETPWAKWRAIYSKIQDEDLQRLKERQCQKDYQQQI